MILTMDDGVWILETRERKKKKEEKIKVDKEVQFW